MNDHPIKKQKKDIASRKSYKLQIILKGVPICDEGLENMWQMAELGAINGEYRIGMPLDTYGYGFSHHQS